MATREHNNAISTMNEENAQQHNQITEAPVNPPQSNTMIVLLDVGGTEFKTTTETLCMEVSSRFAEDVLSLTASQADNEDDHIVNGEGSNPGEGGMKLFYDRDPTHFRIILNYLRSGMRAILPTNRQTQDELAVEAEYYKLTLLLRLINDYRLVTFHFTSIKGDECVYQDTVRVFCCRDAGSYIAKLAKIHGQSGVPIYLKRKAVPGFSPENFNAILEYLKLGPGNLSDSSKKHIQTMSTDFLEFWGMHGMLKLRHRHHEEKIRKISMDMGLMAPTLDRHASV